MSVSCDYCVLSSRGLYDGPLRRPEEFYRLNKCVCVCVCVIEGDQGQQSPSASTMSR